MYNTNRYTKIKHISPLDKKIVLLVKTVYNFSGALATAGALSYGLWSFRTGRSQMSQQMMRLRIVAQGFTITALVVGVMMTAGKNFK